MAIAASLSSETMPLLLELEEREGRNGVYFRVQSPNINRLHHHGRKQPTEHRLLTSLGPVVLEEETTKADPTGQPVQDFTPPLPHAL